MPARSFRSGVFVSRENPALRLQLDPSWRYLGLSSFDLKGIAHVERYHFAVTEGNRITRGLVLQFENILPGVDEIYRWTVRTPRELGGIPYQHNVFMFNVDDGVREEPEAEMGHTMKFLAERGISLDSEQIVARFARVIGDDKLHEFIIFYSEPVAASGHRLAEVIDASGDIKPEFRPLADSVTSRALRSFSVLTDNRSGS
jgi:hypothetical protein